MTEQKYIDFHMHSFYSDGMETPAIIVKTAAMRELDVVALTDHDMTAGIEEAVKTGEKWGIKVISGVEISTNNYHLLGLGMHYNSRGFEEFIRFSGEEQRKVCQRRVLALRSLGVPITLEKVREAFPYSRLGKMNLQMTLMQDKECRDFFAAKQERFSGKLYRDYLKRGSADSDKLTAVTDEMAIKAVHEAGGIVVIAHPFKDVKDIQQEMAKLRSYGLDGLEIQLGYNGRNDMFREYAKENNLFTTYGSDYHGCLFRRVMLEREEENVADERLVEKLGI